MRVVLIIALALTLTGCIPVGVPSPTVTVTVTAEPPDSAPEEPAQTEPASSEPITLSGDGATTTERFALDGDYLAAWQTLDDCVYYGDLEGAESDERAFAADAAASDTTYLYGLRGEYYLAVNTGPVPACPWTVTFTPQ